MIRVFADIGSCLKHVPFDHGALPENALWIDLVQPTDVEEAIVEATFGIEVPTRDEMREIEATSRLYQEDGAWFMTATVFSRTQSDMPVSGEIVFILVRDRLITLRYHDPAPFATFPLRAERSAGQWCSAELVLAGLLEAIVDRIADALERVGAEIEMISRRIFAGEGAKPPTTADFSDMLLQLGRKNDTAAKMRDSLVGLGRLVAFFALAIDEKKAKAGKTHVKSLTRDVQSLADHCDYLSNKITFLQDAVLGMINLEQNKIIKIMSVAAVVFLPPTLIGTVYGMNFDFMPELRVWWAYPLTLTAMAISAVAPYVFFRWRGWL